MSTKIFTAGLVVKGMRDNGFKDAAHAVAELIDNSIQWGLTVRDSVEVELLCIEEETLIGGKKSRRINQIAVYDNGCGMDKDKLEKALAFAQGSNKESTGGLGKFGMGLPNSSISQCKRVDVYSWKDGKVLTTYLDIDEIEDGMEEVPVPKEIKELPKEWQKRIKSKILESGTLVVWSDLDRLKWRRSKTFFTNTSFIVGRMYRHFLNDGKCRIRLASYLGKKVFKPETDEYLLPNDPLYLMTGTSGPEKISVKGEIFDYTKESAFIPYPHEEIVIMVNWNGEDHEIIIRGSQARKDFRRTCAELGEESGNNILGKHTLKNQGLSVVREGRELELNLSFINRYIPTERWWGIEVQFPRGLDEVFGVTNNKQAATAFEDISIEDLEKDSGIEKEILRAEMELDEDPRLIIIEVCKHIKRIRSALRSEIKSQTAGVKKRKQEEEGDAPSATAGGVVDGDGLEGRSDDKGKKLTPEQKAKEIDVEIDLDFEDADEEDKIAIKKQWLKSDKRVIFNSAPLRGSDVFFDVSYPAGKLKITINSNHILYEEFIKELEDADDTGIDCIKLVFAAFARVEDTMTVDNENDARRFEEYRKSWGRYVTEMISSHTGKDELV